MNFTDGRVFCSRRACVFILIGQIDLVSNGHSETSAVRPRAPFCTPLVHSSMMLYHSYLLSSCIWPSSHQNIFSHMYLYTREQDLHHITHVVFSDEVHTCKSIVILREFYAKERMRPLSQLFVSNIVCFDLALAMLLWYCSILDSL